MLNLAFYSVFFIQPDGVVCLKLTGKNIEKDDNTHGRLTGT